MSNPYMTTRAAIRAHHPCADGYKKLCRWLDERGIAEDQPFPMAWILGSNGLDDALWALCVLGTDQPMPLLFAADCAERVLHLYETRSPQDLRPRRVIETARRFACGQATAQELAEAKAAAAAAAEEATAWEGWAAWAAAAARAAAWEGWAAWAAAAARAAAAGAAAWATEAAAAEWAAVAERDWQIARLRDYLNGLLPAPAIPYLRRVA